MRVPEAVEIFDPAEHGDESLGVDAVDLFAATGADRDQPAVAEHREVLFHRRACHVEMASDFCNRQVVVTEQFEDVPAGRVGERAESGLGQVCHDGAYAIPFGFT